MLNHTFAGSEVASLRYGDGEERAKVLMRGKFSPSSVPVSHVHVRRIQRLEEFYGLGKQDLVSNKICFNMFQ